MYKFIYSYPYIYSYICICIPSTCSTNVYMTRIAKSILQTPTSAPEVLNLYQLLSKGKIMLLQIIYEYPYNCLVTIDPVQNKISYEDLLEFQRSKVTIQIKNYEPESLDTLYDGNIARSERHVVWLEFIRHISVRKNP